MTNINESLQEARKLEGVVASAIVDSTSGMCLGTAGGGELDLEAVAAGVTEVLRAKQRSLESLGQDVQIEDLVITTSQEIHILKTLSSDANLFFYLILKRSGCNLALAKHRLAVIDRDLVL